MATQTTTVTLTATAADCASTTTSTLTFLGNPPDLVVSADPTTVFRGQPVDLLAESNAGLTFDWTPAATLDDPSSPAPVARPLTDTFYEVAVTGENGCTTRGGIAIRLNPPTCDAPLIFIPSAFTPNTDGRNDLWQVLGTPIDELHVRVYNRWGELVWEHTDPDPATGWDGTFRGKALPSDVYGYYVEVRCRDGERFSQQGNVTLIR